MRKSFTVRTVASVATAVLLLQVGSASAQNVCRGDVDNDGVVTTADVSALLPILFDPTAFDVETQLRADVNGDAALTGADVVGVLAVNGLVCVTTPTGPSPTPTGTPTQGTPTSPTVTPTPTETPPLLPTPMPTCVIQEAQFGTTIGELASTDCQRNFFTGPRVTDQYSIVGTPGTAITIAIEGAPPLVPFVAVVDADGQFEDLEGPPPVEFTVTTAQPYQIFVTSDINSEVQLGTYSMTLTARQCAAPLAVSFPSARPANLDGTECPDPSLPTVATLADPADVYTFTITDVPQNVSITMQQLSVEEDIFPALSVIGPDGFELVTADLNVDCTLGDLICSQVRFLALQAGTYTLYATGDGGTGRYSLTLASPTCNAKKLNNIPPDAPLHCSGSEVGCMGTLEGNITKSPCAAPLPEPGSFDEVPEPGSPADLYEFTANAGDVISVEMDSEDDAHLSVIGPAPSTAVVARAGDGGNARLAATLVTPGTYTLVAGNNNALLFDDEPVNYTIFVQKCPVRGTLNPSTGRVVSDTFNGLDCFGAGDVPVRTYAFVGTSGDFVTTRMTSSTVDSFVRVFAPDGSRVENDDDLFDASTVDAQAGRLLPISGTYFVEVSASPDGPPVDVSATPPPSFVLRSLSCATTPAETGVLNGSWQEDDCDLGGGRRADIYTFPGAAVPDIASVAPPSNGCVVELLSNGVMAPGEGCSTAPLSVPVAAPGTHGFILAGESADTRGAYTVGYGRCPATSVGYGANTSGALTDGSCTDATGVHAAWFLIQAPADLVRFNGGLFGQLSAGFPAVAFLSDAVETTPIAGELIEDAEEMFRLGDNLGVVVQLRGAAAGDRGNYVLSTAPAALRQ